MSLKPQEEMIIDEKNIIRTIKRHKLPQLKKNQGKIWKAVSLVLIISTLCGCADISHREFLYAENPPPVTTEYSEGVGGDLLIITESGSNTDISTTEGDIPEELESFSPTQQEFINNSYFMGDSICLGLGISGFVSHCSAKAGVAARNIEEFSFDSGGAQVSALTALVNSNLKRFVFLMGSNDVNIESEDEYAKYYNSFLSKVEALCPDADIYVLSIPPVTADSTFCYNYQIDSFNIKLKEMIYSHDSTKRHYVDIASYLKDEQGNLKEIYSSDNTVHLTKTAYYALLSGMCKEIGIE